MTPQGQRFYRRLGYAKNSLSIVGGIILCVSELGVIAFVLGAMLILAEMMNILEKSQ